MPATPEIWIDTPLSTIGGGNYGSPDVITLADGSFIVSWQLRVSSIYTIQAIHYDAFGNVLTPEFVISPPTVDRPGSSSVKATPDGGFVVIFMSETGNLDFQRFDSNFTVTQSGTIEAAGNIKGIPSFDVAANGSFFVSYEEQDGPHDTIRGRLVDVNGNVGGEVTLRLDERTDQPVQNQGNPARPDTIALTNGNFITTFRENDVPNNGNSSVPTIEFRITNPDGSNGALIDISSIDGNSDSNPVVAALTGGGFAIAWQDGEDITVHSFTASGSLVSSSTVSSLETLDTPTIVGLNDGGYFVAWRANNAMGELFGQRYDSSGIAIGTVENFATGNAGLFAMEMSLLADGRIAVTWNASAGTFTTILDARDIATSAGDYQAGTTGDDSFTIDTGILLVDGGLGNDNITGNNVSENIAGGDGDDTLNGAGGYDVLIGEEGADNLFGNTGSDRLDGGLGSDMLDGGAGIDTLDLSRDSRDTIIDLSAGTADFTSAIIALQDAPLGDSVFSELAFGGVYINIGTVEHPGGELRARVSGTQSDMTDAVTGIRTVIIGIDDFLPGLNGVITTAHGFGTITVTIMPDDSKTFSTEITIDGVAAGDVTSVDIYRASATTNFFVICPIGSNSAATFNDIVETDTLISLENIIGSQGDDTVIGDGNVNVIEGGQGNDIIDGGGGDDTLIGGAGIDILDGGDGIDTVDYENALSAVHADLDLGSGTGDIAQGDTYTNIENIIGSDFDDTLTGDSKNNLIEGGIGADTLDGGSGNDNLRGEAGNDTLDGGDDNDIISGGNDNDNIDGGAGNDTLRGDGGDDTLDGGTGLDSISAGVGDDTAHGGDGDDSILGQGGADILYGDGGADTIRGGSGNDALYGGDDDDVLFGQGNNDILYGEGGNDTLSGAAGSDQLFGGDGNDVLNGSVGGDRLDGGAGDDVMNGGGADGARDTFVFAVGYDEDRINGFDQLGNDRLEIDDALWVNAGTLTAQEVVDMFGSLNAAGTILTLDFGNGDILEIQNGAGIDIDTFGEDIMII